MQTLRVNAEVAGVHKVLDDLTECQRDDGKIVAGQAQNGYADDKAEQTRHNAADNKRQQQCQGLGAGGVIQADPDQRAGKSAHAHKPGVTKAQLAQNADGQVQRNRHNHISADGDQLTGKGVGQQPGSAEDLDQQVKAQHDAEGDEVALGGAFHGFEIHSSHLTLSR